MTVNLARQDGDWQIEQRLRLGKRNENRQALWVREVRSKQSVNT